MKSSSMGPARSNIIRRLRFLARAHRAVWNSLAPARARHTQRQPAITHNFHQHSSVHSIISSRCQLATAIRRCRDVVRRVCRQHWLIDRVIRLIFWTLKAAPKTLLWLILLFCCYSCCYYQFSKRPKIPKAVRASAIQLKQHNTKILLYCSSPHKQYKFLQLLQVACKFSASCRKLVL